MKKIKFQYQGFFFLFLVCFLLQSFIQPEPQKKVGLLIKPMFGNKKLSLDTESYITPNGDTVSVSKLRFYLSAIQLTFKDGSVFKENNSYHLVDAEDSVSLKITLDQIPQKEIAAINFNIGVDSLASVSGALDGDLDPIKGMYWAWNSGYINAKLEGKCNAVKNKEFEFHVGGYLPPYQSIRKVSLKMEEENINKSDVVITADVQQWFKNIYLSKTNRIVIPGADAVKMSEDYATMFSIKN